MPVIVNKRWSAWASASLGLALSATITCGQSKQDLLAMTLEQRLGEWAPLDARFTDSNGRTVQLGDYFGRTPVILMMGYYECPNLCTLVLNGASDALAAIALRPSEDYRLVFISIDPRETTALAAANKAAYTRYYGKPGAAEGWEFLTGDEVNIRKVADAIGFHHRFDADSGQYAHPSGMVVATPEGQFSRYFYGIEFNPRDLRLALVEASHGKLGALADQLLLLCYHYNPSTGKYGLVIHRTIQMAGTATVAALGGFIGILVWRERKCREGPG